MDYLEENLEENKRNKIRGYVEIVAYGVIGLFSAALLFFGTLYPELTMVEEAYRVTNEKELTDEDLKTPVYRLDKSKVKVKSRLFTYVQDSLE